MKERIVTAGTREATGPQRAGLGADPEADLVARLGELALATRLKRLSERLFRDVGRVYRELDVEFEPRWFALLQALLTGEARGVTELARTLGWTHPAVNQLAAEMERAGLLQPVADPGDGRRRLLRLTPRGRRLSERLAPVWEEIRSANAEWLHELSRDGHDLLATLGAAEQALDRHDMHTRITQRLRRRREGEETLPSERLEIVPYRPFWRRHFEALNREWLESLFEVEPHDAEMLADPHGRIIKPGGAVFFARLNDRIVGTGALVCHGPGLYEIAKIAVTEPLRRHGVGGRIVRVLLKEAQSRGAKTVFLETSPRLIAARRWYQRLGFRPASRHPLGGTPYNRRSVVMILQTSQPAHSEDRQYEEASVSRPSARVSTAPGRSGGAAGRGGGRGPTSVP